MKTMDSLIIQAVLNGSLAGRDDHPHLPLSTQEIVADAKRCRDAGASIIQFHARDEDGTAVPRQDVYAEVIEGIREECPDVLISVSTGGHGCRDFGDRVAALSLQPDFATLTPGSFNQQRRADVNEPDTIRKLAMAMRAFGIVPCLEIYELGMADHAGYLIEREVLEPPFLANLILGGYGTMAATIDHLCTLARCLPEDMLWAAAGVGEHHLQVAALAVVMGGHVRVGLEDYLSDGGGDRSATNPQLIDRVVKIAGSISREIATPEDARDLIGLQRQHRLRIAA